MELGWWIEVNKELFELISHIKSRQRAEGICIFLGAGADIASGGETFSSLKHKFLEKSGHDIPYDTTGIKVDDIFSEYFEKTTRTQRTEILEELMQNSQLSPSDGYKLLALLVREKLVNAVVTTNFNNIYEIACQQMGTPILPFIPSVINPQGFGFHKNVQSMYLKMHGDIVLGNVSHLTEQELNSNDYDESFVSTLENIIINNTIIFSGYSGNDAQIAQIFDRNKSRLKKIFWCDPVQLPNNSPLFTAIGDFARFIRVDFETLLDEISINILPDVILSDNEPPFILSLFFRQKNKLIDNLFSKLDYKQRTQRNTYWIRRKAPHEHIERFLMQEDRNLCMICGGIGIGKTALVAQICDSSEDINIVPFDMKNLSNGDIIANMVRSLGYFVKSDMIFLFRYFQCLDENKINTLFVIDNLSFAEGSKDGASALNTFFEIVYMARRFNHIKFLVSIRTSIWNEVENYLNTNFMQSTLFRTENDFFFSIGQFSSDELDEAMKKNGLSNCFFDEQTKKLLTEPAYFGLLTKARPSFGQRFVSILDIYESFSEIIKRNFSAANELRIARAFENATHLMFELGDETFDCSKVTIECEQFIELRSLNIFCGEYEKCEFYHQQIAENYFAKGILRKNIIDKNNLVYFAEKCSSSAMFYNGLLLYLALYRSAGETITLLCNVEDQELPEVRAFVQDVFNEMAKLNAQKLIEQLSLLNDDSIVRIADYIVKSCTYMPDNIAFETIALIMRLKVRLVPHIIVNARTFAMDRLSFGMRQIADEDIAKEYFGKQFEKLRTDNPLMDFAMVIRVMSKIGPDNTATRQYKNICATIKAYITSMLCSDIAKIADEDFISMYNSFLRNADTIFFNADDTLPEKFNTFIHDHALRYAVCRPISRELFTEGDVCRIREEVSYLNSLTFFVCNLAFIVACDNQKSVEFFDNYFERLKKGTSVEELDFFLSALFVSEYVRQPLERTYFSEKFKLVISEFSEMVFQNPGIERLQKRKTVRDYIESEFTDGFNPLAFYFYTAPATNYRKYPNKDSDHTNLELYFELADNLAETGQQAKILRILHAVSQMISIWPNEGFNVLSKFFAYESDIVNKAILKVLEENYTRYPAEAMKFIDVNRIRFNNDDIGKLKSVQETLLSSRTLEQLHWARMLYFLKESNPNIARDILAQICESRNLYEAIKGIMLTLLNGCSCETTN